MEKIAIVGLHNLHLMQFLYKYTDLLDEKGVKYDVLYWDRDLDGSIKSKPFNGNPIAFNYKMSNYQPKYKKIIGFVRCIHYMNQTIKKRQYDRVILLTTQTALPLYFLNRDIRNRVNFIFDYRDLTYERIAVCKKIIQRIIAKSEFTAISSLGFKEILGESDKFLLSHNVSHIIRTPAPVTNYGRIRLVYWGTIRQVEFNKRICDVFGNDSRFEIFYHGEGYDRELRAYCEERGYKSVRFSGRYMVSQIEEFAANTDILLNLYENDEQQKLALTVKLYDGIRYGLPMLIARNSYMEKMMDKNSNVCSIDINCVNIDDIVAWYQTLNRCEYPYEAVVEQIRKDDMIFKKTLMTFIER